jgi:hypothetical protein
MDKDINIFMNDSRKMINSILTKENTADDCNEKEVDELINFITKDNNDDQIKNILNTLKMMEVCKIKSQENSRTL